ncbi:SPW repeat protein [Aldersonia kunmingensis]|uniref:SPW repeat protein n=1 Tax=Aldersonia kunmingensis TaxID=408066 RepID=UPI00082A6A3C|nr:SPW repeat protein [Aldersonia kunmingensis]
MNVYTSSRAQDVAAVVLGAITALTPLWVDTNDAANSSLIVLGVLIAASGLAQMLSPDLSIADVVMGVLGFLLFLSPWVMGFTEYAGAAWTAWIIGVLTMVVAFAALPAVNGMMHGNPVAHS